MSIATLADVLQPALRGNYAVMGVSVFAWDEAQAYVAAAEEVGCAVILQAGPKFRAALPLDISARMFRALGEGASVPVVAHVDHARTVAECEAGIAAGFTSVMFDGSAMPLKDNIAATAAVVDMARPHGVSVEAEIGVVGYPDGIASEMTDAAEAGRLARETGIDALAVSVGNTHLQQTPSTEIDMQRLAAIEAATDCPLVIHGGSGVPSRTRRRLALNTAVCKFNIGTELRQLFGDTVRETLARQPRLFDRLQIISATQAPLQSLAADIMKSFQPSP